MATTSKSSRTDPSVAERGNDDATRKQGREWEHYLDAVTFTHNICISAATGYSPFELVYGRQPDMPEDIMYGFPDDGSAPEATPPSVYKDRCTQWLAKAYKSFHIQQAKLSEANRARRDERMMDTEFKIDQWVLYWKPRNAMEAAAEEDPDNVYWKPATKARIPQKWSVKWTGPHRITKRINANVYAFLDSKSAVETVANVNRLYAFHAWSDDIKSTSDDIDEDEAWVNHL